MLFCFQPIAVSVLWSSSPSFAFCFRIVLSSRQLFVTNVLTIFIYENLLFLRFSSDSILSIFILKFWPSKPFHPSTAEESSSIFFGPITIPVLILPIPTILPLFFLFVWTLISLYWSIFMFKLLFSTIPWFCYSNPQWFYFSLHFRLLILSTYLNPHFYWQVVVCMLPITP